MVRVRLRTRAGRFECWVDDEGDGISAELVDRVFDRFYRADGARSRNSARVGLGLAIARGIASAHGGSAEIESELGKGTTVSLIFPGIKKM